jgi:divalent metal cation (Fe/Co/Zn/Cd) transporter
MGSVPQIPTAALRRSIYRIQAITIGWMSVEAVVALLAAWRARSPALLGFGADSAIELFSAIIVLWRFRSNGDSDRAEKLAARIAGSLLFMVAACVVIGAWMALSGYRDPQSSPIGIVLLVVAAFGMPWLANQKRKLAVQVGSASLRADAAESALCGYMSWIALAGLTTNAVFHKPWADPVAALALAPLVVKEGWEAIRVSRLRCQCC